MVARGAPRFSGADLANLANEAAIGAARDNREVLNADDVDTARDRILLGRREGSNVLLPEEKHAVAGHEAGHCPLRTRRPGREGDHSAGRADPRRHRATPAGRATSIRRGLPHRHPHGVPGRVSRRARRARPGLARSVNDLAQATELATKMVREYGLSDTLGPVGYPSGGPIFLSGGGAELPSKPFAEATQARIDAEVARLLRRAEQRATDLLTTYHGAADRAGHPAAREGNVKSPEPPKRYRAPRSEPGHRRAPPRGHHPPESAQQEQHLLITADHR